MKCFYDEKVKNIPFNSVMLEKNQLNELDMSKIFEGLTYLTHLEKISIKNNAIGEGSISYLSKILERSQPHQLRKLVIAGCQINLSASYLLFETLT